MIKIIEKMTNSTTYCTVTTIILLNWIFLLLLCIICVIITKRKWIQIIIIRIIEKNPFNYLMIIINYNQNNEENNQFDYLMY